MKLLEMAFRERNSQTGLNDGEVNIQGQTQGSSDSLLQLQAFSTGLVRSDQPVMVWNRVGRDVRRWEWKRKVALGFSLQATSWNGSPSPSSLYIFKHTTLPLLSVRDWDNALYTLITLSNQRALCWVLSKSINMKVCTVAAAPSA